MSKTVAILGVILFIGLAASAQKTEVIYFKAELACCQATACNSLESDVKAVIESHYKSGDVQFTAVKISDQANKALVEKYNAKSQTVVIVSKTKKSETVMDVSDVVRNYSRTRDKANLEKDLLAKLTECMK